MLGAAGQAVGSAMQEGLAVAAAVVAVAAMVAHPLLAEVRRCVPLLVCLAASPALQCGVCVVLRGVSRSSGFGGAAGQAVVAVAATGEAHPLPAEVR
jgi:hypothetical protein